MTSISLGRFLPHRKHLGSPPGHAGAVVEDVSAGACLDHSRAQAAAVRGRQLLDYVRVGEQ